MNRVHVIEKKFEELKAAKQTGDVMQLIGDAEIVLSDEEKMLKQDDILREEGKSQEQAFTQMSIVIESDDKLEDKTMSNLEEGKGDKSPIDSDNTEDNSDKNNSNIESEVIIITIKI